MIEIVFIPPLEVPAGGKFLIELCLKVDADNLLVDTLVVGNYCAKRNVLSLLNASFLDKNNFRVFTKKNSCNRFVEIIITDSLPVD